MRHPAINEHEALSVTAERVHGTLYVPPHHRERCGRAHHIPPKDFGTRRASLSDKDVYEQRKHGLLAWPAFVRRDSFGRSMTAKIAVR